MNYTKVLLTPKQLIYKLNSISKDIREEEFIDYTLHFENKGLVFPIGKFEVDNTNKMIILKSGDMMTEKRFELGKSEDGALLWIIDNTQLNNGYDGGLSTTETIDLLNRYEEIIKQQNKVISDCYNIINDLEVEAATYKRKFIDCVDRKMGDV